MAGSLTDGSEILEPGTLLGRYELVAPLGHGGMAFVWAARLTTTGQLFAVKILRPELAENPSFRDMFLDEARIASRVRHIHVCGTFELGQHDNLLFLVMEWVDGPSLMRVLRPGPDDGINDPPRYPFHPRLAARIVADTGAGLHAAHETLGDDGRPLGLVHRDVSPHNLLVTIGGIVKVTDFGVAKAQGKSHMTMAGQLKGKLAYMAPEQLVGSGVDRRTDVFALGCVLYEITTGTRPFVGEHDPQVMAAIMMGQFRPPGAVLPGYPPALEAIVMRALANEAQDRFPSADHMRLALEEYLRVSGAPVTSMQIADLLRERCGPETDARGLSLRPDAPRESRMPREVATIRRRSETGAGGMEIAPRSGPREAQRGFGWLVAAAILGAAMGLGVLSYLKATRFAKVEKRNPVVALAPLSAPPPVVPTDAGPRVDLGDARPPPAPDRRAVRLHITPKTAVVVVDGVVLPRGTEAIGRPDDGGTTTVLVRADKHEDMTIVVDNATPDVVEVALTPQAGPLPAPAGVGAEGGAPRRVWKPAAPAASSIPGNDTPPNPYD